MRNTLKYPTLAALLSSAIIILTGMGEAPALPVASAQGAVPGLGAAVSPTPDGTRSYVSLPLILRSEDLPTEAPTAMPTEESTAMPTDEPVPTPTDEPTPTPTDQPPADGGPVTPDTPLLGAPRASVDQMVAEIRSRSNGEYTEFDVRSIVEQYDRVCREVGVDPTLAVAQMLHETGYMSSFWAGRPRRNPAGIGVTGLTSPTQPDDTTNWAYDPAMGLWRYGISFSSWNVSVRAHVGRLLAYAITDQQANDAQRALIVEALSYRGLPARYRGVAPTLRGLAGTWAVPGDGYADKLATIANRVRSR